MSDKDIKQRWDSGVENEINFWRNVIQGDRDPFIGYKGELLRRATNTAPVLDYIAAKFPVGVPPSEVSVLDVAAGPVSCVGWQVLGLPIHLTPIDALAEQYAELLDEAAISPPTFTQKCDGEEIGTQFAESSFDVVHIRNALDHCYDAVAVVANMLQVLKPGGWLIICGYTDEAEFEKYEGLHQWNVREADGDLVVWRPGERHGLRSLFGPSIEKMIVEQKDDARWTFAVVQKKL